MDKASKFIKSLNWTPGEHLGRAVLYGSLPYRFLDDRGIKDGGQRIEVIDGYDLPEAQAHLVELEAKKERSLASQAPRHREEKYLHRNFQDELRRARARVKILEKEKEKLSEIIKATLVEKARKRQAEGERKAAAFTVKANSLVESVRERPDNVDMVIQLAKALDGKGLRESFGRFFMAKFHYEDFATEKRFIEEKYNLIIDDLPKCPNLSYTDKLQKSIEQLIGGKLEGIKRNIKWRRIRSEQGTKDSDVAARYLGTD